MDRNLFTYSEDEVRDLVLKIHPRIVPYINSLLSEGGQSCLAANSAEDIFYDVLCTFIDKHSEIRRDHVKAYLYRAVKNRCLNILSRNREENSSVRIDSMPLSAREILAAADFAGENEFGSGEEAMPDISDVLAYSEHLPDRTKDIFCMSRIEGMTHSEIAEILGISTRAVEKHLQNSVKEYRYHFGMDSRRHKPS